MSKIYLDKDNDRVITRGLAQSGMDEICLEIDDSIKMSDAENFLRYVAAYVEQSGHRILPGETFPYGYWLVKFRTGRRSLDVWEYDSNATDFVRGASLTLRYWREQHEVCDRYQASFLPPRPDRLTVVDEGVLQGLPVQAVRYPSPEHMSGWWITTDAYNGEVSTLRREHTYHVTAARPDLAAYIALPYGFRFRVGDDSEEASFDDQVAASAVQ
jgi:hypothetical protein